jgi:hypothetical protein
MKKAVWLVAVVTVIVASPARLDAWWYGSPYRVDAGFKIWFNIQPTGPQAALGPWYLYFPYEAHFQTPAPWGYYPQWPMPQAPGTYWPGMHQPGMYPPAPPQQTPAVSRPASLPPIRPTSYYSSPVPSYWYGR